MYKVEPDPEALEFMIKRISDEITKRVMKNIEVRSQYPAMLSRKDLTKVLGVSDTVAGEIMNSTNFPRIKGHGHKCVPTHLLFQWMDEEAGWKHRKSYIKRPEAL